MNDSVSANTGIEIHLSGEGSYSDMTLKRTRAMLRVLLEEADASAGVYAFSISGRHEPFERLISVHLEVVFGNQSDAFTVMLRACHGEGGSIFGRLQPPPKVDRRRLFQDMQVAIKNLNSEGWVDAINSVEPGAHPERRSPMASSTVSPILRVTQTSRQDQGKSPEKTSQPSLRPEASVEASTLLGENEKLLQLLRMALRGAENGVFSGKGITELAQPLFPDRSPRGLSTGTLLNLQGLGWIRRVGTGEYQVEASCLRLLGLVMEVRPLPKLERGRCEMAGQQPQSQRKSESLISDLTEQLRAVDGLIAERKRLGENLAVAEQNLAIAQEALSAFDQRVRPSLGPLVSEYFPSRQ